MAPATAIDPFAVARVTDPGAVGDEVLMPPLMLTPAPAMTLTEPETKELCVVIGLPRLTCALGAASRISPPNWPPLLSIVPKNPVDRLPVSATRLILPPE